MILQRLPRVRRRPVVDVGPYDLYVNPYAWYRVLRDETPVAYAPALRHYAREKRAYWLVTRWDDVVAVLKDDETFHSPDEPADLPASFLGALPHLDGERHAAVRAMMQSACRPQRAGAFADEIVSEIAEDLLDGFARPWRGGAHGGVLRPARRQDDRSTGRAARRHAPTSSCASGSIISAATSPARPFPPDAKLDREIDDALLRNLRRLEAAPDESLLSSMLEHRESPERLSDTEILANAKFFAAAGTHELADLTAHALVGLLSRPEQMEELRADPRLAKPALEEAARWSSPVGMVPRLTTTRTELAGVRLPARTLVAAVIASANRDERRWSEPSRYDLHRDEGMHIAYASGIHFCIGAWFARAAAALALQRLVERLPALTLAPSDPLVVTGWRFRDVRRLAARWG